MPHKGAHNDLTVNYVKEILEYNPNTGDFIWKKTLSKRAVAGKLAGCKRRIGGRVKIGINGTEYMAHRLAWLVMTGDWPTYEIDHKDLNQSNNKWENLREATPSQNQAHRPIRKNNATGITGVCWDSTKKKWLAYINKLHLGHYSTKDEAISARKNMENILHGEFKYE